jgi:hypothetical protein
MRDLHLTHLDAILIVDDEDVQSVLAMLHHFRGDNQDVLLYAGLQLKRCSRTERMKTPARRLSPRLRRRRAALVIVALMRLFICVSRAIELQFGRLALSLRAGDGRRAVRRFPDNLVKSHLPDVGYLRQADDDHAEVKEIGDDRKQRRFVAAVLCRARGEGAADLPCKAQLPHRPREVRSGLQRRRTRSALCRRDRAPLRGRVRCASGSHRVR